jgi:predicted transcriptional regulator
MQGPFPEVQGSDSVEDISKKLNKETNAVLVRYGDDSVHIVTKHDVIGAIG